MQHVMCSVKKTWFHAITNTQSGGADPNSQYWAVLMGQLQLLQAHQPRVAVSHPSQVALHSIVPTKYKVLLLKWQSNETDTDAHKPEMQKSQHFHGYFNPKNRRPYRDWYKNIVI